MLAFAAIVIDRNFRIVAMTSAAEHVLQAEDILVVRNGRIEGASGTDTIKLNEAFRRFMNAGSKTERSESFIIAGKNDTVANIRFSPLVLSDGLLGQAMAILSVEPLQASAQVLGRLTTAEAEVAAALLAGGRATEIACRRNVSVETVRSQIKSIYAKFDVRGHVELIAALRQTQ